MGRLLRRVDVLERASLKASAILGHQFSRDTLYYKLAAPVAYQVILEPGIGHFREFEFPRVHTRINSWGLFLVRKLTCGKRESVR